MTFGAACGALLDSPSNALIPPRQLEALRLFISSTDVVGVVLGSVKSSLHDRKYAIRLLASLFTIYEAARAPEPVLKLVDDVVPNILTQKDLFPSIFTLIAAGTQEDEVTEELLQLVYKSLFSVIPDSSPLIIDWFESGVAKTDAFAELCPKNRALALLVSIQFLNINPLAEPTQVTESPKKSYRRAGVMLSRLHTAIGSVSTTTAPVLGLVWALVLHQVALDYMADPDPALTTDFLKPTLHVLDGVHFDFMARDALVPALEHGGHGQLTKILELLQETVSDKGSVEHYCQTVSDVVVSLLSVCKPTEGIAHSLRIAVSSWPRLQADLWQSEVVRDALSLAKTKCPAGLGGLVEFARCIPLEERVSQLSNLGSFVDYVPLSSIVSAPDRGVDCIAARTSVDIFPSRLSDGQGALTVDAGTHGVLLTDSAPQGALVLWQFQFNGWSLLGRYLENKDQELGDAWGPEELNILDLISETATSDVLQALSAGLERADIVAMITLRLASWLRSPDRNTVRCVSTIKFLASVATLSGADRILPIAADLSTSNVFVELRNPEITQAMVDLVDTLCAASQSGAYGDAQTQITNHLLLFVIGILGAAPRDNNALLKSILGALRPFISQRFIVEALVSNHGAVDYIVAGITGTLATRVSASFATEVIESRLKLGLSLTLLEAKIYRSMPEFTDLFVRRSPGARSKLLLLLAALVNSAPPETPLLAFLNDEQASELLSQVENSVSERLEPEALVEASSRFFEAVAKSHQQGLLILLCKGQSNVVSGSVNPLLPRLQESLDSSLLPDTRLALLQALAAVAQLHSDRPRSVPVTNANIEELIKVILDPVEYPKSIGSALTVLREQLLEKKSIPSDPQLQSFVNQGRTVELTSAFAKQSDILHQWCAWLGALVNLSPKSLPGCSKALLECNANSRDKNNTMCLQRANMAFFLLRSLPSIPADDVLPVVLHQLAELTTQVDIPLLRANLRVVNSVLRSDPPKSDGVLLEVLDICVIRQTRILSSTDETSGLRELLGVLRRSLELIGDTARSATLLAPLGQAMADSGVHRALTRVYSLVDPSKPEEVVSGELVLCHILEWLPIGIVADHFISSGLLTVLLESSLSREIQRGGVVAAGRSPAAADTGKANLHGVWRRGLLPILLQLVVQLGPRIAQEVSYILLTFRPQIRTCLEQWRSGHGRVSLALIEETVLLHALLVQLSQYGFESTAATLLPREELIAAFDQLLSHRKYLSTRVVDDEGQILEEMAELRSVVSTTRTVATKN